MENVKRQMLLLSEFGILEFPCRDPTYCTNCAFDDCISYDARINGFYSIKDYPYKSNKIYGIKGMKNIKKKIIKNGPYNF